MSTISRWPWATRRRISESTAAALRLRDAPRTSGITQKLHENEQPSWIFTKARTRSSRASACTQPIAPTSPATNAAVSSLRFATTVTLGGSPASDSPPRLAAQPVTYTRPCVRAARAAALRLFATASFVTQQPLITATSASVPAPRLSVCPSRRSASRTSCASACETLQPRKSTRNVATTRIVCGSQVRACTSEAQPSSVRRSTWVKPRRCGCSETR